MMYLLSLSFTRRCGVLSGGIGIALNLLLFGGKLLAGIITASIAVTADAFNNLSPGRRTGWPGTAPG